jgi:probable F420-dependent oxidoreductase
MKFGVFGINFGPCAEPEAATRVARAAEEAGFDSVWTGEHVVLPDPQQPPSPAPPQTPFLDPAVALSPQRNPVVLAKEMASVDVISGGRLILGVAAGYLHQEFAAVGANFAERGARTDEYIDAMRALWSEPKPSFHGKFVSFAGIDAQPRPVQKPSPQLVVGGHSTSAHRRAVRRAHGWYGFALDLDATRQALQGLAQARTQVERPAELGELEISVTPPPGLSLDDARRYADLGVDRLVLLVPARDADGVLAQVEAAASGLLGRV